jgi:small subunit ribosomal protein S13
MRFLGLNISDTSKIGYALTNFFGIGWDASIKILKECNINLNKKVKDLNEEELKRIIKHIENNYKIEGELREIVADNIKRLKDIGSYRGMRHVKSLPVRGQRTRSNARTKRGKRKTVGALKKETWAKIGQEEETKH